MSCGGQVSAIVTGAASGIGAATAARLHQAGFAVIGIDRHWADEAVAPGRRVSLDLTDTSAIAEAIERETADTTVGCIVHAAGITRHASLADLTIADWTDVLAVNLLAAVEIVRAALPRMQRDSGGSIVLVGSVHAKATGVGASAYAASKGALAAMMRALAVELGDRRIRVNVVHPGTTTTPFLLESARTAQPDDPSAALRDWSLMQPLGRAGEPDEVAALIAFLASPDGQFITGAELVIDGGLLARLG